MSILHLLTSALGIVIEIFFGVIVVAIFYAFIFNAGPGKLVNYISPSSSKVYTPPPGWLGTPIDSNGRFVNDQYPFYQNYFAIMVWLPSHISHIIRNKNVQFPVRKINAADVLQKDYTLVWLGHASFFLRINGINILIDPQFNKAVVYKRHSDNPIDPDSFTNIRYILLSHDHSDHCDKKSLRLLVKNNPGVIILSGLKMEKLVQSFCRQKVSILTAEWYEAYPLNSEIEIFFVPSRHYSKRVFKKFNSTLWGAFVIRYKNLEGDDRTIYYGGDSGYGNHFKIVKELFEPDVAILGIGSFSPEWFMEDKHMSPQMAMKAFKDTGASTLIPMHFGTFNLANESIGAPGKIIKELMPEGKLASILPGDTLGV